jgi:hypothetical protein
VSRYYFHVQGDAGLIEDPEGTELCDERAAFEEAGEAARAILGDAIRSHREPAGCAVVIADEQGRKIGIVGFVDVLPETIKSALMRA